MSDPSLSAGNISQAMEELPDAFDFCLRDDASSLGSDSELNGMAPYRKTDRYGFIGGSSLQNGQDHLPVVLIRHRETKWLEMTAHWEKTMARRYRKVKLLCRKGIPSSLRARCWPLLCGGQAKMERSPEKYQELLDIPGDAQWVETITKDIHRQFPFHEMFLSPEGPGQQGLLQLLKAYTVYRPEEGYCQAQGPVGALLLMHMPPEQAFWCLVQICDHYLPGYYSPQMEALVLDSEIFTALLHRVCPKAFKHLQKHGVGPLMYMPEWFLCLFARTLPFPTVLRVWDAFLSEGVKVLFRVGLLLVRLALGSSEKLRGCPGLVETLEKLRSIPPQFLEEDSFMAEVHDVPISESDLERECRIQLGKLHKTQPKFQYNPKQRLSGAKAIFDVQQLEDAQSNKTEKEIHAHTFHIPQIKVDPPPSPPREQKRASEMHAQKKEQKRKKPDTRGKTFHAFEHPTGRRERKLEPEAARSKSSFYLEA
ncbi:carabin isoform X1 [Thamnophis elegans]|uniref:carabin isoform X1 n=1 Tax=Thamnophis elegans TaxID=35005 RepID=UPI0013784FB1|nr:carabin isoform X1 [Thamnophis elegans]